MPHSIHEQHESLHLPVIISLNYHLQHPQELSELDNLPSQCIRHQHRVC
jgi:hypothetical protein